MRRCSVSAKNFSWMDLSKMNYQDLLLNPMLMIVKQLADGKTVCEAVIANGDRVLITPLKTLQSSRS